MSDFNIGLILDRLGFTESSYVETVLVTRNRDGSYNMAPMGAFRVNNNIEVKPFKSSTTYYNLLKENQASFNITDDPMLFLKTAFKEELNDIPYVKDWKIDGVYAVILAEKKGENILSDIRASFTFEPISISIYRNEPRVFSRGRAEAIEAVIHATRVKVYQSEGSKADMEALLKKIEDCIEVINKVSSLESSEMKVAMNIQRLLEKWGIK